MASSELAWELAKGVIRFYAARIVLGVLVLAGMVLLVLYILR